jgi:hypothetical protein
MQRRLSCGTCATASSSTRPSPYSTLPARSQRRVTTAVLAHADVLRECLRKPMAIVTAVSSWRLLTRPAIAKRGGVRRCRGGRWRHGRLVARSRPAHGCRRGARRRQALHSRRNTRTQLLRLAGSAGALARQGCLVAEALLRLQWRIRRLPGG